MNIKSCVLFAVICLMCNAYSVFAAPKPIFGWGGINIVAPIGLSGYGGGDGFGDGYGSGYGSGYGFPGFGYGGPYYNRRYNVWY